jgi:hypothetical protein
MSVLAYLDRWRDTGAISAPQHETLASLARRDRISLFGEINALLYLGVLAVVGGVTWTIASHSARLGDAAIVAALTGAFVWSLYYCVTRTLPYSPEQVEAPGIAFDYVLYLGCLLLAVDLGYIEARFHPFGANWDHSLLLASAVFFVLAYRFDNRLVLSLALSSLAGWFGVRVSHFGDLFGRSLRPYALVYGALVAVAGAVLHRAAIKKHFLETYLHVAAQVLFIALFSGSVRIMATGSSDASALYLFALIALSALSIVLGIRFARFAFVAYGVVYGYLGISARLLDALHGDTAVFSYFLLSGIIVIAALVVLARRFGREA